MNICLFFRLAMCIWVNTPRHEQHSRCEWHSEHEHRCGYKQHCRHKQYSGQEQLGEHKRFPSCSCFFKHEYYFRRKQIYRLQLHFGLERIRWYNPNNFCHVSKNTTRQPENVGDQVKPWSICTRSTSFKNGTLWLQYRCCVEKAL